MKPKNPTKNNKKNKQNSTHPLTPHPPPPQVCTAGPYQKDPAFVSSPCSCLRVPIGPEVSQFPLVNHVCLVLATGFHWPRHPSKPSTPSKGMGKQCSMQCTAPCNQLKTAEQGCQSCSSHVTGHSRLSTMPHTRQAGRGPIADASKGLKRYLPLQNSTRKQSLPERPTLALAQPEQVDVVR